MGKLKLNKKSRFFIGIGAVILLICILLLIKSCDKGDEKTLTSSTLIETINISELSTSKFTYNGIAKLYKDESKKKVKCHIRYNATVKAGIDMNAVSFEIDDQNKTIKPILPEITITSNTVDEKSLSFIPADSKVELKDALIACQNDALEESQESDELLRTAKENLKSIIEALLLPVANSKEYTIIWN